jgi:hypothetical protein
MCSKRKVMNRSLALVVSSVPFAAFAHLNIVTAEGRVEQLKPVSLDNDVYKQVVDLGNKKFINHPVKSFANDLPLGLALPSIIPSDWVIDVSDELSNFPVSWEKTGNWDDVVVEISKRHNLVVLFDWNRHVLKMKANDAEMLDIHEDIDFVKPMATEQYNKPEPKLAPVVRLDAEVQSITDGLVKCSDNSSDDCSSPKVDIEKLALDTNWISETGATTSEEALPIEKVEIKSSKIANSVNVGTNPEQVSMHELHQEERLLDEAMVRDKQLKSDFRKSIVLHGDGSFEDFVNGGGLVTQADPDTEYVYVFKRGKLFETINKWAELNDFHVENDIFATKKVDYPNAQDIKIKGKFKDVVTLLLNKYRKADVPVNHRYFIGGGSSTLHIFESKYESLYVN